MERFAAQKADEDNAQITQTVAIDLILAQFVEFIPFLVTICLEGPNNVFLWL